MTETTNEVTTAVEIMHENDNPNPPTRHVCASSSEDNSIHDFITQVESVYRGLGIPVFYGVLSILANKSVFFIGGRGTGKTRTIKSIPEVQGTIASKWDAFTLDELNILCGRHINGTDTVHDKHFVFKVKDFSSLSEYHRDIFLTVCSGISSDGEYRHVTTPLPYLNIERCQLTMLIAIQPRIYSLMSRRCARAEDIDASIFSSEHWVEFAEKFLENSNYYTPAGDEDILVLPDFISGTWKDQYIPNREKMTIDILQLTKGICQNTFYRTKVRRLLPLVQEIRKKNFSKGLPRVIAMSDANIIIPLEDEIIAFDTRKLLDNLVEPISVPFLIQCKGHFQELTQATSTNGFQVLIQVFLMK